MSELINYSTGTTVPASWLNRAQLREEGKASYVIYQIGGTTYAKAQLAGGTDYSNTDATAPIVSAVANGGLILIKKATYSITRAVLGAGSGKGIAVPSNTRILAEPGTVITQPGTDYLGNLAASDQASGFFINSDTVNGNTNIEIAGMQFTGTPPNSANTSYTNLCYFLGVSNLSIHDIIQDGAGMSIRPLASELNTSQQPIAGHCVGGSIRNILIQHDCPYGIAIQHGARYEIANVTCKANGSIDDILLIGDSGQNNVIRQVYLDKTMADNGYSTTTGHCIAVTANASAWGCSNILMDGLYCEGVPTSASPCVTINVTGIARNISVKNALLENSVRGLGALISSGTTAENWVFEGITARNNNQQGIQIEAAAILNGLYIGHNQIYNNGKLGSGQTFGLALTTDVSPGMRRVFIHDNSIYDDQGGPTQNQCIRFDGAGTYDTLMSIHDNYFNQTAFGLLPTSATFLRIRNNVGYNPVGVIASPYDNTGNFIGANPANASTTLTSAKTYTCITVPIDLYLAGGTVSAMTKNASTIPYNSTLTTIHLEPGDTWSITFSVIPTTNFVMGW